MPVVKFRYSSFEGRNAPIVPVSIKTKGKWYELWAYVDSGAKYSLFSAADAKDMGLKVAAGQRIQVGLGDGSLVPVYLHRVKAKLGNVEFSATVGFTDKIPLRLNVLGRTSVFDNFKVAFDDRKKEVWFQKNT